MNTTIQLYDTTEFKRETEKRRENMIQDIAQIEHWIEQNQDLIGNIFWNNTDPESDIPSIKHRNLYFLYNTWLKYYIDTVWFSDYEWNPDLQICNLWFWNMVDVYWDLEWLIKNVNNALEKSEEHFNKYFK